MNFKENKFFIALILICALFFFVESYQAKNLDFVEEDELKSLVTSSGYDWKSFDSLDTKTFTQNDFIGHDDLNLTIQHNIKDESGNCILYNITLHSWIKLFDFSLYSIRMLSVLFGIGTIIVAFYLTSLLFDDKKIGLLSSLLIACSPLILSYGIRTRTYSMAIFFSFLATFLFVKWMKSLDSNSNQKLLSRTSIAYGIIAGLSPLTHYFCFYILMIHFIFLLPSLFKGATKNKVGLILPFLIMCLIISPWMLSGGMEGGKEMLSGNEYHLNYAKGENKLASMTQITNTGNTINYIKTTALTWSYNGSYWNYFNYNIKMRYLLILFVLPILFIATSLFYLWRKKFYRLRLFNFLIALIIIGPLFCILLAFQSGHTVSFSDRYSTLSLPYFSIVMAYGIYQLYNKSKVFKIVTLCFCSLFAVHIVVSQKLDFDIAAEDFKPHFSTMNDAVQKQLMATDLKNKTIEFPYKSLALKFNFNLIPTHTEIQQKINPDLERNKIYLYDAVSGNRSVLYEFPADFDADPNYHAK